MTKVLYLILAWSSLALGVVGIVLPLLPTTPFILLAAWSFAKSSERYHNWIRRNRFFGRSVRAWEARLGLTKREKVRLVVTATVFFAISFVLCTSLIGRVIVVCCWPIPLSVAILTRTRGADEPIPD